ncbi:MAG: Sensor histidine kinase ResE [Chloroflexi bacterium]|nr:Sensor histidine kinase ResE [Chloroflexota bacterium]
MLTSLRSRLWLTYALVISTVLSILAVGLLVYLIRHPLADRQAIQKLDLAATIILRRMEEVSLAEQKKELQKASENFSLRIIILKVNGNLLVDTEENGSPLNWPQAPPLPRQGILRDQERDLWLYASRPLPRQAFLVVATPRQGGLRLLKNAQFREVLQDEFLPPFLQAGGIALLLSLLFAFWIARWVATPLKEISDAAQDVAEGAYRTLPIKGPKEVRALAKDFNEMSQRVRASQQSQKDFVANVSHELKTPLTSVQGFSQAILDKTAHTPESIHQAARIIHTESSRMYRLVVDLLDLARFDSGIANLEREPVALGEILRDVNKKLAPQAEEAGVHLTLTVEPLPTCVGDADRLAQVFTNLVDNAIGHTPPAGSVHVQAGGEGTTVRVTITDTGEGIPPQSLPRIFERFYQIDKSRKDGEKPSTGLGLAIAQQIIQAHQGKITVDSVVGEGSVFVVHLPAVLPDDSTVVKRDK